MAMAPVTSHPILPSINPGNFTELQHRIDERMRGVLGEYAMGLEQTVAYKLGRDELFNRVESLVGHTPLIHVEDIGDSSILAKVESQNPTENHYDRVFPRIIKLLEDDGVVVPGNELIEVTSGSGGRAFAWAARVLGYKAHVIIPPELPKARIQDMLNFGAEVEITEPGYMTVVSKVHRARIISMKREGWDVKKHETPDYTVFTAEKDGKRVCFVNHSFNEATVKGFDSIADEIYEQMPEGQKIDYTVSVMGNGTSTAAISRTMKSHYPNVQVIGLEDERSPHYFGQKYPGEYERRFGEPAEFVQHDMFGSSAPGVTLKYGNVDAVDDIRLANPDERNEARDNYNQGRSGYEQIGNSSAASLVAARKLALEHPGSNIVILFYDKADQYGTQPTIATNLRFMYDRPRPDGVPRHGWRQKGVGSIALMPRTVREAHTQH
jgi:cysteine synthase